MPEPRYVSALFVGGPDDGKTRHVEYRTHYVVDVWTPADFTFAPADGLVVPIKVFHYRVHVLAGDDESRFYVYAPDGWTGTDVMEALVSGYGKKILKTG